jgi:hypothetical protein
MNRRLLFAALAAVAGGLVGAPAALADDAAVFNAYIARQASEVNPAANAYARAARRARRTGTARAYRAVIRADQRINAVLGVIEGELLAQGPSSDPGSRARTAAVREVRGWARGNRYEIRGVRALIHGRRARAGAWLARADRTMRRTYRYGRRAVARFREVGLTSPVGAISAKTRAEM